MCPSCAALDSEVDPSVDPRLPEREQLQQIDASVRAPVVLFTGSGLVWLMLATVLGLIASYKLQNPEFWADCEWFTFGRVYPAAVNAFLYGWGCQVAFAVSLWLMARLSATKVRHLGLLHIAGGFWNFGVLWGVAGILLNGPEPAQFLEMPRHIAPLLAFSYVMIAAWAVLAFHYRRERRVFVSQWYLLAALFWFPWVYFSSVLAIYFAPGRGVVQAIANAWYVNSLIWLWFAPIALAVIYYFLPKLAGRAVWGYYLSVIGFWSYALFAGWAGPRYLVYGPVPVWVQSVGVVGSVMMLVPVVIIGINHHFTLVLHFRRIWGNPVGKFIAVSAVAFTVSAVAGAWLSLRDVNIIANFTQVTSGQFINLFYACFSMAMFGAVYFLLPRVLGREWPARGLVGFHFWCSAVALFFLVLGHYIHGWQQGVQLDDPQFPFIEIVKGQSGLNGLRTIALAVLFVGQAALFLNAGRMLLGFACEKCAPFVPWPRLRAAVGGAR